MGLKEEVLQEYRRQIEEHYEANQKAGAEIREAVERSTLYFHGRALDKPLAVQKIYSEEEIAKFREIVRMTHTICCKAIRHYIDDPAYRRLFAFPPELEELILADAGYPDELPMARFDIFYHEDSGAFKFCEINTDGTSAMNESYVLEQINILNPAHQAVLRQYELQSFELFDTWVKTFLTLYEKYRSQRLSEGRQCPKRPNVAIVDFLDRAMITEFYEFARRFQQAGINAQVLDIRDLRYEGGMLISPEGEPVDAIYRRAVTSDVMDGYADVQPLVQAVRDGKVFLCGAFRSQVVHTKRFFTVVHLPETRAILTEAENRFVAEHVPHTFDLTEEGLAGAGLTLADVLNDKDRWILKPNDSYGSDSVSDGKGCTQQEWEALVHRVYGRGFICQEYAPQYATDNVDFANGDGQFRPHINMSGLFSYNGEFPGVYTRQSAGTIITSYVTERNVVSYVVKGKKVRE